MNNQNKVLMDEMSAQFVSYEKERDDSYLEWALENYMNIKHPLTGEEEDCLKVALSESPKEFLDLLAKDFLQWLKETSEKWLKESKDEEFFIQIDYLIEWDVLSKSQELGDEKFIVFIMS